MTPRARIPLALLLTGALVLTPGVAQAHDELIGSDPVDGDSAEAPEEVTLTYSGQITSVGAVVQVTGEDGQEVTDGSPEVEGPTVVQDLVDDLPDGEYAVAWRVTSEDGHPIAGEFDFSVTGSEEATTEAGETQPTDQATTEAEPTQEATTEAEATEEVTAEATDAASEADSGGLPFWAVAFIAAALIGVAAVFAMTWSRRRP